MVQNTIFIMKGYPKKSSCLLIAFALFFLNACQNPVKEFNAKESILNLLQIDEVNYQEALDLGLILAPYDTACFADITVQNASLLQEFRIEDSLSSPQQLLQGVGQLYLRFGDIIGPALSTENFDLSDLFGISNTIEIGGFIPQCAEISKYSEAAFENQLTSFDIEVVEIEMEEHTLNLAKYEWQGLEYAVLFDAQLGFFFPSLTASSLIVPSLKELLETQKEEYEFYWLPNDILHKRRNFTNEILPCNVLPQLGTNYQYAPEGSPYKYMLLGPSFHKILWFDLGQVDKDLFKTELMQTMFELGEKK